MKIGPLLRWTSLAVPVWLAAGVSLSALPALLDDGQVRRDERSITELVDGTVARYRDSVGEHWTRHATIGSVVPGGNTITFRLALTAQAEEAIKPRWAKNRIKLMGYDIRDKACSNEALATILAQGGEVRFESADDRSGAVFPTVVSPNYC